VAERKRFLLRLDPEVFDAVERWAGDDLRSINAQIEYLLGDALRRAGRAPRPRRVANPQPVREPSEDTEATEDGA
jgi:hypothetical protein